MKTLLVYFSSEGNTEYVAEKVAKKINGTLLKLIPQKSCDDKQAEKYIWEDKSVIMAEKPTLESYDVNIDEFDKIIFGFPVWGETFAPPLRTFITDNKDVLKDKKISAYACQDKTGAEKALKKLAHLLEIDDFEYTCIFIDPKEKPSAENRLRLEMFCKKLMTE